MQPAVPRLIFAATQYRFSAHVDLRTYTNQRRVDERRRPRADSTVRVDVSRIITGDAVDLAQTGDSRLGKMRYVRMSPAAGVVQDYFTPFNPWTR